MQARTLTLTNPNPSPNPNPHGAQALVRTAAREAPLNSAEAAAADALASQATPPHGLRLGLG